MLKIVHDRFKQSKKVAEMIMQEFLAEFDEAIEHNKDIEALLSKTTDVLNPLVVINLLERIPDEVGSWTLISIRF